MMVLSDLHMDVQTKKMSYLSRFNRPQIVETTVGEVGVGNWGGLRSLIKYPCQDEGDRSKRVGIGGRGLAIGGYRARDRRVMQR